MEELHCIVVGGGAAGLSAALVLGRARKQTLVVDADRQSNRAAHGIGGLLGHEGLSPSEFYARGREELRRYPSVDLMTGTVEHARRVGASFEVDHDQGTARARTLVLAMGATYVFPKLAGIKEHWGDAVFHCPFCHGWENRDRHIAILDDGKSGLHRGPLLRGWTDRLTLLTDGAAATEQQRALEIPIDERPVTGVRSDDGVLTGVVFEGGGVLECEAVNVAAPMVQRSNLAQQLGVEIGPAAGPQHEPIAITSLQATNVPGVFAAGDASLMRAQVTAAVASGASAAASVVAFLMS